MTVLWIDGFDYYSSTVPYATRYPSSSGHGSYGNAGRLSGLAAKSSSGTMQLLHPLDTARSTVSCGFGENYGIGTSKAMYEWLDSTGTVICTVFVSALGMLSIVRGSVSGTNVLGTATVAMPSSNWCYIEIEFTRHASAGACAIYIDGTAVINVTGVNTGASDVVSMGFPALTNDLVDDYYVVSGATKLGEQRIVTLVPTADTAQRDFTASTSGADNYSMVDEAQSDGDTTYVRSTVAADEDLYAMSDLPFTPSAINAVQPIVIARKEDALVRSVNTVVHGSPDNDGIAVGLSTSYKIISDLYELNPNTDAAWTASEVNALEVGMKVS